MRAATRLNSSGMVVYTQGPVDSSCAVFQLYTFGKTILVAKQVWTLSNPLSKLFSLRPQDLPAEPNLLTMLVAGSTIRWEL